MRHDETDTVFYEAQGDPRAILAVAVEVCGAGFHPDTDPREYEDGDGLQVFDEADALEIEGAISALVAEGIDPSEVVLDLLGL